MKPAKILQGLRLNRQGILQDSLDIAPERHWRAANGGPNSELRFAAALPGNNRVRTMGAFLFCVGLFLFFLLVGFAVLALCLPRLRIMQEVLVSPAVGIATTI